MRVASFPAVAGRRPKVLILGTLPGVVSLRLTQYYGHPQNKFWDLLGHVLGEDLRSLGYARRLAVLKRRGVALWDVVADAHRPGSMDASIRNERHNDVPSFIKAHRVKAVFFNGQAARRLYERRFGPPAVPAFLLPSSSPAHASVAWAAKARGWRRIRRYL